MNGEDDNPGLGYIPPTGAHRFITLGECNKNYGVLREDIVDINIALWGSEKTTGLVKDINDLKRNSQLISRIGNILLGVIASAVTAYIIMILGA